MSFNVDDYTISELQTILNLEDDDMTEEDIINTTNKYIDNFSDSDERLSQFFEDVQTKLLQYINGEESHEYQPDNKQTEKWIKNEALPQDDKIQKNKNTDMVQKIDVYENDHMPMNREQLGINNNINVPVAQDSLNPNLKNTIKRFINLDSQFRQYTSTSSSSSCDYTCDLSDTIKNALSLSLYSYQIPYSWYTIDTAYGNTCFWIFDQSNNQNINVSISVGNYSQEQFIQELNDAFTSKGFSFTSNPVTYNKNSGILTMKLYGGSYTDPSGENPSFNIDEKTQIIFYDFNGYLQCNVNCVSKSNHYFNSTLGWIMGYRLPYENVNKNGNIASSILDLNGTKYLILVIDDYNQNHVNNSLVSISQFSNTLKIPSYYSTDIPNVCIHQKSNLNSLVTQVQLEAVFDNTTQNGLLIAGKYENDYMNTEVVLPSAPRTLTNAQLYTINSINANNNNLTNYLAKAPTSSDILAIIPVKTSVGVPTGSLLVEFSGSLQDSERIYFGPVNIERMAIKLLNDKGNVVNLNGNDWCVSLIAECLYQY